MSFCTTKLMGRCGNQFYQIATLIAYAKKHGFSYHVPIEASNCDDATYFHNFPTFRVARSNYEEPLNTETQRPYYVEIPKNQGICLVGYWQTFKYFDDYRQDVIDAFKIPYNLIEYISIHVRRGDYLQYSDSFPPLPLEYYHIAINYFKNFGYNKFMVFSDDIQYCREVLKDAECEFVFQSGNSELKDIELMSSCQHNIVANSSFSYVASWLNQNPEKIVISPSDKNMFKGSNMDMIPNNYLRVNIEEKCVLAS